MNRVYDMIVWGYFGSGRVPTVLRVTLVTPTNSGVIATKLRALEVTGLECHVAGSLQVPRVKVEKMHRQDIYGKEVGKGCSMSIIQGKLPT